MCDYKPEVEPGKAHWAVKLITSLIIGALIFEIAKPVR